MRGRRHVGGVSYASLSEAERYAVLRLRGLMAREKIAKTRGIQSSAVERIHAEATDEEYFAACAMHPVARVLMVEA